MRIMVRSWGVLLITIGSVGALGGCSAGPDGADWELGVHQGAVIDNGQGPPLDDCVEGIESGNETICVEGEAPTDPCEAELGAGWEVTFDPLGNINGCACTDAFFCTNTGGGNGGSGGGGTLPPPQPPKPRTPKALEICLDSCWRYYGPVRTACEKLDSSEDCGLLAEDRVTRCRERCFDDHFAPGMACDAFMTVTTQNPIDNTPVTGGRLNEDGFCCTGSGPTLRCLQCTGAGHVDCRIYPKTTSQIRLPTDSVKLNTSWRTLSTQLHR